jgi:hypothetical protein
VGSGCGDVRGNSVHGGRGELRGNSMGGHSGEVVGTYGQNM